MRDFQLFDSCGKRFRCVAMTFDCRRLLLCLTKVMKNLARQLRETLRYRVIPHIDDFLIAPCQSGKAALKNDATKARKKISKFLYRLELVRIIGKERLERYHKLDHLELRLDRVEMKVLFINQKVRRTLLARVQRCRRNSDATAIRRFCKV